MKIEIEDNKLSNIETEKNQIINILDNILNEIWINKNLNFDPMSEYKEFCKTFGAFNVVSAHIINIKFNNNMSFQITFPESFWIK